MMQPQKVKLINKLSWILKLYSKQRLSTVNGQLSEQGNRLEAQPMHGNVMPECCAEACKLFEPLVSSLLVPPYLCLGLQDHIILWVDHTPWHFG